MGDDDVSNESDITHCLVAIWHEGENGLKQIYIYI